MWFCFFFQAEDGIRDADVTGVQTCALPISVFRSRIRAVAVGAALFGAVHLPNWTLCALTAIACTIWMTLFLRWPNLWVHGLSHGWLASLAYIYVLGEDPLAAVRQMFNV